MEARVNLGALTLARIDAAILEVKRQRKAMAATYPAWVQEGRIKADVSEARQAAISDAEIALCTVAAALSAPPVQPDLPAAASIGRPLPYDPDVACDEAEPTAACRFCSARLERAVHRQTGAASYRCSLPACPGHLSWASLDVIAKGTQEGATK